MLGRDDMGRDEGKEPGPEPGKGAVRRKLREDALTPSVMTTD
jgi:hypothetical protein